jgi:hypothetical protein
MITENARSAMVCAHAPINAFFPFPGMDPYLEQYWRDIHLVEIDLLRAGERVLSVGVSRIPASHQTLYQVYVYHAATVFPCHEHYRAPLRERLPIIRVPLRPTDLDVPLDLQTLIDQCCCNGGYDEDIDYRVEPDPPLNTEDDRWADTLLRQAGRR